jgi:hypothetical protein
MLYCCCLRWLIIKNGSHPMPDATRLGCFIVIVMPKAAPLAADRCLAGSPSPADSLRREVIAKHLATQTDELQ